MLRISAHWGGRRCGRRGSAHKTTLVAAVATIKTPDVKLRGEGISQSFSNMDAGPTYSSASNTEELGLSSFNWAGVMGHCLQKGVVLSVSEWW